MVGVAGEPHVRVGAVLAKGRRPYAWECNVSGPVAGEPFHEGHAEIRALRKVRPKSTLYIARLDRAGALMPSAPCKSCTRAIEADGNIRQVVFYDGHEIKKVKL